MCTLSFRWLGKNCSLYRAHKVLYTECQSWTWPLTQWPKINRVPPLIINNLHVKFESHREVTVVCILPTRQSTMDGRTDAHTRSLTQPHTNGCITISLTPWHKINRVPPLIIHNLHVKFGSDWAKAVVAIVSTRSYIQSAKVDLGLLPHDPKSTRMGLS